MKTKTTKLLYSNSKDPYFNLATEEWAIRNLDTSKCDYLFIYQNTDCVVIGRNQNVFQEVNLEFCKKNDIQICRRVSGGGTVFHDLGNLNWSFISKFDTSKVNNYQIFSSSIIKVLKQLGLKAYLNDRNAIMVDSYKISGQAQFTNRKNILSHGTLLFDSNIERLNKSTINKDIVVNTKATKSVRSVVKTLKELSSIDSNIKNIINLIVDENIIIEQLDVSSINIYKKIQEIEKKYKTHKWIYERSSKCVIEQIYNNEKLFLHIEKAKIVSIKNKKGKDLNLHPFLNMLYIETI